MILQSFLLLFTLTCYTHILTSSDHATPQKKRARSHSAERLQVTPSLQRTDVVAHSESDDDEDSHVSPHAPHIPFNSEILYRELYERHNILLAEYRDYELILLDQIFSRMIFPQLINQEEPFRSYCRNILIEWRQSRDHLEDYILFKQQQWMQEKNKIEVLYALSMYQRNIIQRHQAALAATPTPVIQNNTFWLYNPFLPKD